VRLDSGRRTLGDSEQSHSVLQTRARQCILLRERYDDRVTNASANRSFFARFYL
jgi:hypothetical protein